MTEADLDRKGLAQAGGALVDVADERQRKQNRMEQALTDADLAGNTINLPLAMSRRAGPRGAVCAFEANPEIAKRCQAALLGSKRLGTCGHTQRGCDRPCAWLGFAAGSFRLQWPHSVRRKRSANGDVD
jgi:hypothetical protein